MPMYIYTCTDIQMLEANAYAHMLLGLPLPEGLRSVCKLQKTKLLLPNCPRGMLKLTTTVTCRGGISGVSECVR